MLLPKTLTTDYADNTDESQTLLRAKAVI